MGRFHNPQETLINYDFLKTLSKEDIISGKGEIIKYGFLSSEIFNAIKTGTSDKEIISLCADYKLQITTNDFTETGKRKFLNLGHTFAHAIEKKFNISHGLAVLIGLKILFRCISDKNLEHKLYQLMDSLSLNKSLINTISFNEKIIDELMNFISKDKKAINSKEIEIIIINKIGHPETKKTSFNEIHQALINGL